MTGLAFKWVCCTACQTDRGITSFVDALAATRRHCYIQPLLFSDSCRYAGGSVYMTWKDFSSKADVHIWLMGNKKVSVFNCNSSHENLYIFKFTRAKSVALTALVSELQLLQQLTDPNSRYEERCVISSLNRWYFYEICDCGTK